jgi:hypothetical protein
MALQQTDAYRWTCVRQQRSRGRQYWWYQVIVRGVGGGFEAVKDVEVLRAKSVLRHHSRCFLIYLQAHI